MWRLWHYLFGWHYVAFHWGFGRITVCRVRQSPNGHQYIMWWGEMHLLHERWRKFTPLTWDEPPYVGTGEVA
jgi:hypothetical protein